MEDAMDQDASSSSESDADDEFLITKKEMRDAQRELDESKRGMPAILEARMRKRPRESESEDSSNESDLETSD